MSRHTVTHNDLHVTIGVDYPLRHVFANVIGPEGPMHMKIYEATDAGDLDACVDAAVRSMRRKYAPIPKEMKKALHHDLVHLFFGDRNALNKQYTY